MLDPAELPPAHMYVAVVSLLTLSLMRFKFNQGAAPFGVACDAEVVGSVDEDDVFSVLLWGVVELDPAEAVVRPAHGGPKGSLEQEF